MIYKIAGLCYTAHMGRSFPSWFCPTPGAGAGSAALLPAARCESAAGRIKGGAFAHGIRRPPLQPPATRRDLPCANNCTPPVLL